MHRQRVHVPIHRRLDHRARELLAQGAPLLVEHRHLLGHFGELRLHLLAILLAPLRRP